MDSDYGLNWYKKSDEIGNLKLHIDLHDNSLENSLVDTLTLDLPKPFK